MSKSTSLYEFGYNFLGPMCSEYFHSLVSLCEQQKPDAVLFLAREGYFFEKTYKDVIEKHLSHRPTAHYLLVSRTFLFRILIGDKRSWKWSLQHKFDGKLKQLLLGRFGFSLPQLEHVFSEQDFETEWKLPEQLEELSEWLERFRLRLMDIVNDSRANYVEYLTSLQLEKAKKTLIVDVGYSGTIQKLLSLLLNIDTQGLYFIATREGRSQVGNNEAEIMSVFKQGVKMGDGYTMLDRSLLLESLLTSPNGQFVDIRRAAENSGKRFDFYFGRRANAQRNIHDLEMILQGAKDCVDYSFNHDVRYTVDEIESLFETFAYSRRQFPRATWVLFDVDDAISGHGNVNPLRLFGL